MAAGKLAGLLIGHTEEMNVVGGLVDVYAGTFKMGVKLLVDERRARHLGRAAHTEVAPELIISLAADQLGVLEDLHGVVAHQCRSMQATDKRSTALAASGRRLFARGTAYAASGTFVLGHMHESVIECFAC